MTRHCPSLLGPQVKAPLSVLIAAFTFGTLCAAGTPKPLSAQTFWPDIVDTVDISADRPGAEERLARRTGFTTVVPLGPEAPPGRDLSDLLDRTAGLHIHRYGGFGSFSLASVRGSAPGQVSVCLDGVPISAADDAVVNLAGFAVNNLDHAEIYRGAQTASFGGPPTAGVINLVTPDNLQVPLRIAVGAGDFGTRLTRGSWGGSFGYARTYLSAQYSRSRGDFEYVDDNGTIFNQNDDRIDTRKNNDFEDSAFLWKIGAGKRYGFSIDYTGQHSRRWNGIAGHKNVQTEHIRFETDRDRHQVSASLRPPLSRCLSAQPVLEVSGHTEQVRDRFENPEAEAGLGAAATDDRTRERGASLAISIRRLPFGQTPRLAAEIRRETWVPEDLRSGTTGFARTREHRTVSIENHLSLGPVTVEGAYRWARAADNYAGVVQWGRPPEPSAARVHRQEGADLGLRVELGSGWIVKANRGRLARFPTFAELFGFNGLQDGNPQLEPERGAQWDAGLGYGSRGSPTCEFAYFERLVEDQIYLIQNSRRTVKAANLDRAWVRGIEAQAYAQMALPGRLIVEFQANHTWQEALDVGKSRTYRGKRIPNLPRNESYFSARLLRRPWFLQWETSARSSSYWHRYNRDEQKTPTHSIHDLSIEREFLDRSWNVRIGLRNLADHRVEDIDGYPLPGRYSTIELMYTHFR